VIAPLSAVAVRVAGTKLTTAAGLLLIAAGLWQVSNATVTRPPGPWPSSPPSGTGASP